jgi:exportin-2 (importin alpha re-exporter)
MIARDPAYIHSAGFTEKLLGVFQMLLALKQYDHEGMNLLIFIIVHYPATVLEAYMKTIYQVLFRRLQASKTPKFVRILIIFFSILVVGHGAESVVNRINEIQPGLFWMFLEKVWLHDMQKVMGAVERKTCIVALAALLCDSAQLRAEHEAWYACLFSCLKMIHCEVEKDDVSSFVPKTASADELRDCAGDESVATNLFVPLNGAMPKPVDLCSTIADPNQHFRARLHQLLQSADGQPFISLLQSRLSPDLFALIQ